MKLTTKELVLVGLFTALSAIGAFIKIPTPYVNITLQLFFTTMAGIILGPRLGPLSVGLYVLIGLMGIPVFTQGGGPSYIFQPTFGYLVAFILGTYVTAKVARHPERPSFMRLLWAALAGLVVVYVIGVVYVYMINSLVLGNVLSLRALLTAAVLIPLPGDLALSAVAAGLGVRLWPVVSRRVGQARAT